jgi:hypothetical protein
MAKPLWERRTLIVSERERDREGGRERERQRESERERPAEKLGNKRKQTRRYLVYRVTLLTRNRHAT